MEASFRVGAALAMLNVEGIAGTEVSFLAGSNVADQSPAVEVVLEGPDSFQIWRVNPRVVAQLAAVSDPDAFGAGWAAALTEAHASPPELTDEQKLQTLELAQRLGVNTYGRTVENFHDDYVGHHYEAALWQGVVCELAQLARFAVRTGRQLYLTRYID